MPFALLEAMGAGLCCCVSDVDGMAEAIQHGLNGFLCAPGKVPRWCEQIETFIANPALRVDIGNRAKSFARERFSINGMASSTMMVYQDAVRSHRRSSEGKIG